MLGPDKALLTSKEAAEFLGLNEGSLRNMRKDGEGPKFIKLGRLVRYRRSELEKYLDKNTYDPERYHAFSA